MAVPFCIPTSNVCTLQFLHISPAFGVVAIFLAILTGVYHYLILVVICISLVGNDVEYHFFCLFAICTGASVKYLLISLAHFVLFFLHCWIWRVVIYSRFQLFIRYVVCKHFLSVSTQLACSFFTWLLTEQALIQKSILPVFLLWIVLLVSTVRTLSLALDPKDIFLFFP